MRSFYTGDHVVSGQTKKASIPSGNRPPYAFVLAPTAGELSSTTYVSGTGVLVSAGALGYGISADLVGDGTISDAALGLIISAIANLSGSGDVSGSLLAFLNGSASLSGTGDLAATINAIAESIAALSGSGDVVSLMSANGSLSADIVVTGTGLTLENVSEAVWSALASQYNEAGTMGNKLNGAASAGDPWSTDLPGIYTTGQAGEILAQIQTLIDELHKVRGLDAANPATTTQSSIDAGTIHIDITGDGINETTLTRND